MWDRFLRILGRVVYIFALILLGNWLGDQSTVSDCASKHKARMLGGGTFSCVVTEYPVNSFYKTLTKEPK